MSLHWLSRFHTQITRKYSTSMCSGEEMTADSSGRAGATMAGESTTASNIQEDSQSSNYFANNYRWGWKVAELQLVTSGVCFWVHITKILWLNDERKNVPMEGWLRGLRVMCLCSLSGGRIERRVGLKSRVKRDLRRRLLQTLAGTHYTHIVTVRTYQGQRVHIILRKTRRQNSRIV